MNFPAMAVKFHPFRRRKSSACLRGAFLAVGFFLPCPSPAQEPATNPMAAAPPSVANAVSSLLSKASGHLADGNWDQAVREASLAIQLDSKNAAGYEVRGSIYVQEKLWDRAERDYTTAYKFNPDIAYKYKLAQIKFLQKDYDDARLRFAALQEDARLGDLATYHVFLCDLLDRHEALAARELGALGQVEKHPSYYYCHAAWYLYHDQRPEANKWFASAEQLFDSSTDDLYVSSLIEAQPLHIPVATFSTKDGNLYDRARVFLEETGLRTSTPTGWVTVPLDQLPDDLSVFPKDLRGQIAERRAVLPAAAPNPISLLTFTTKMGKSYDHVRWSVEEAGLAILTPDGWITLPFGQLPADLSSFPPDLQQTIVQRRKSTPGTPTHSGLISFTTKLGKSYKQVKVSVTENGLLILTADGWITVPFDQLPADLSPFPPDLQQTIVQWRQPTPSAPTRSDLVSFTTRQGKKYDQVKASMTEDGLLILTPDGWITVPFGELPTDLSVFPAEWRSEMLAKHSSNPDDQLGLKVVSFTTKRGRHYDQVRGALEETGLRLLTSLGWIAVPFDQLPDDLSVFPEEWRKKIAERQTELRKSGPLSQPSADHKSEPNQITTWSPK
jgi:tetratricopeptide (TPR) repeat protein